MREAVYNALAHNNYAASVPIQIRIEDMAMYISNSCILPRDWTVETLMQTRRSIPFNPSIANAFYRAGYIEAWDRGIQKIIEACRAIGAPDPEYTVLGDDLTVRFTARERLKASDSQNPKNHAETLDDTLAERILAALKENPAETQPEMAAALKVSVASVKRTMKQLSDSGRITHKGGKRFGYWVQN